MIYGIIINSKNTFEKLDKLNNLSIFQSIVLKLSSSIISLFILANYEFYNLIKKQLEEINNIKANMYLLTYKTNLDNYQSTYIITSLVKTYNINIIPIDNLDFNNKEKWFKCNKKMICVIENYWYNPVYEISSSNYFQNFLLNYKSKINMFEYCINFRKELNSNFFNSDCKTTDLNVIKYE